MLAMSRCPDLTFFFLFFKVSPKKLESAIPEVTSIGERKMSMRTATQMLRRSLSTAQPPATPAIRVAASPLAGAPLARGRAEIGAIHHGFAHEDPRPKRKNATRVSPNSIDRPQAACPETGLTYDRKYDCELLRGATVLNEKNGFGLRIPSCDLRGAASWPEEAVSAVRAVIQDARGVLTFPNQRDLCCPAPKIIPRARRARLRSRPPPSRAGRGPAAGRRRGRENKTEVR